MTPHGFSHLFEMFATFTLAYIVIDEITKNPFVSVVTEKVLGKFAPIDKIFKELYATVKSTSISLDTIQQQIDHYPENKKEETKKDLEDNQKKFAFLQNRIESFRKDHIQSNINQIYKTKLFEHLNFFLLLYCLSLIYFGGLYNGIILESSKSNTIVSNLDNALLIFCGGSLLFLIWGWMTDQTQNLVDEQNNVHAIVRNGYKIAGWYYLTLIFLSTTAYYFKWRLLHFGNTTTNEVLNNNWHHLLILGSVFIPLTNFIVYLYKANHRAGDLLPRLEPRCQTYKKSFDKELGEIDLFIKHCGWLNKKGGNGDDEITIE